MVIADIGRFVAARSPAGPYVVIAESSHKMARSVLAEETGSDAVDWSAALRQRQSGLDCAGDLCRYAARGRRVAIVTGEGALPLDCAEFDAIVAQVPAGFRCRSTIPVVDRIDSWRLGAVALWLDRSGVVVESANRLRGNRPWVPQPRPRRRQAPAADED